MWRSFSQQLASSRNEFCRDQVGRAPPASGAPVNGPPTIGPASAVAERPVSLAVGPRHRAVLRVGPWHGRPISPH
eukprot:6615582-Alexandrium_andersonii.AAC.1